MKLSIRELQLDDIGVIVDYFIDSDIAAQNEQYEYEIEFSPRFTLKEYNDKEINERIFAFSMFKLSAIIL